MACPWIKGVKPTGVQVTKLIICGTRTFDNQKLLYEKCDKITYWFDLIEVVLGSEGLRIERGGEWAYTGADYWGMKWAEDKWWDRNFFLPDWKQYGKKAGPLRNRQMAQYTSPDGFCIAFHDGKSPGTASMISEFLKVNPSNHLRVVHYAKKR